VRSPPAAEPQTVDSPPRDAFGVEMGLEDSAERRELLEGKFLEPREILQKYGDSPPGVGRHDPLRGSLRANLCKSTANRV
jgi:hypothetical protein